MYLGVHWRSDRSAGMRDGVCSNFSVLSVFLLVLFLCEYSSLTWLFLAGPGLLLHDLEFLPVGLLRNCFVFG